MQFQLRKEILESRYMVGYGQLDRCAMYFVSQQEKKVGQLFLSSEVSFIAFEDRDLRIDYLRRFFRRTQYPITDQTNNKIIGNYDIKTHYSRRNPFGRLYLGDAEYWGTTSDPVELVMDWRVLQKSASVSNLQESVSYTVRYRRPKFFTWKVNQTSHVPIEGEIESTGTNLLLVFAGLFLLDEALILEEGD